MKVLARPGELAAAGLSPAAGPGTHTITIKKLLRGLPALASPPFPSS
ncbi:hypothetical protein ACFV7Q_29335 [Streptomyces sp. NPDC059851]